MRVGSGSKDKCDKTVYFVYKICFNIFYNEFVFKILIRENALMTAIIAYNQDVSG